MGRSAVPYGISCAQPQVDRSGSDLGGFAQVRTVHCYLAVNVQYWPEWSVKAFLQLLVCATGVACRVVHRCEAGSIGLLVLQELRTNPEF